MSRPIAPLQVKWEKLPNRQGYWLRWWNEQEELLLWGTELVQRERETAQRERDRAESLKAQLRSLGGEPEDN